MVRDNYTLNQSLHLMNQYGDSFFIQLQVALTDMFSSTSPLQILLHFCHGQIKLNAFDCNPVCTYLTGDDVLWNWQSLRDLGSERMQRDFNSYWYQGHFK